MGSLRELLRSVSSGLVVAGALASGGCEAAEPEASSAPREALAQQAAALAGGTRRVNPPVVAFEFRDWSAEKGLFWASCSGALINEHWILTASHCVPKFDIKKGKGKPGQPPKLADGARSFSAYVFQQIEDKTGAEPTIKATAIAKPAVRAQCAGPKSVRELLESPNGTEPHGTFDEQCAVQLSAHPYQKRDKSCVGVDCERYFDDTPTVNNDLALLLINDTYSLSVNQYTSGEALEPEEGALPLAFGRAPVLNEVLIPWGWGKTGGLVSADDKLTLRTAPEGSGIKLVDLGSGAGDKAILPEQIQVAALAGATAVKVCYGDSGGPLVRTDADGRGVIAGIASKIQAGANGQCPDAGQPMAWARIDTPDKQAWIKKIIDYPCRDVGGGRSECWLPRCNGRTCGEGTCRVPVRRNLVGARERIDTVRVDRCVPSKKKK